MTVTKIERQIRHPDRYNIFVDGEFAFGISRDVLLNFGLRKGDDLPLATKDKILSAEELSQARRHALQMTSRRRRSEMELRLKLREKEYCPRIIDAVITSFRELNIIRDDEYAAAFVHDLRMRKPVGRLLVIRLLRAKGIPDQVIQNILKHESDDDELSYAERAAKKQYKKYRAFKKPAEPQKESRRLFQYLLRNGFSKPVITAVLKNIYKNTDISMMEE